MSTLVWQTNKVLKQDKCSKLTKKILKEYTKVMQKIGGKI